MSTPNKLSLAAAILINLNIMLGSGVFINTVLLTASAGALGGAVYLMVALLLLPLIFAISDLMKHQGGTFYEFGARYHPLAGFIMSWSYFTAKLASCALGIHVFVTLIQKLFCGAVAPLTTLIIDSAVLILFALLNTGNLRFGRRIQYGFIGLKMIPLLFIIISAAYYFNGNYFAAAELNWMGVVDSIPFVIFAFAGFEASCSLSQSIENPEKNGPRAILISYLLVVAIVTLYQLSFFGLLGEQLGLLTSFREAYPAVIEQFSHHDLSTIWKMLTLIGIASSSLGASYGIMYSNSWNLFTLARAKHVFGAQVFTQLNNNNIPYWCIIIECLLGLSYLWCTQAHQVPLQQISALGSTIAYIGCALVFIYQAYTRGEHKILALCNSASCLLLLAGIVRNGHAFGVSAYGAFLCIVLSGVLMFMLTSTHFKRQQRQQA